MSTTALRVIELVKSLPLAEQQAICAELAKNITPLAARRRRQLQRLPDGTYHNPEGLPEDDPVFGILEEIEAERHKTSARPAPDFS